MKSIITIIFLTLLIGQAVASPQKFTVCLTVTNNHSGKEVQAGFTTTDWFDGDHNVQLENGQKCSSHRYKHGPKTIKNLYVMSGHFTIDAVIKADASCDFVKRVSTPGFYSAENISYGSGDHGWHFTLNQIGINELSYPIFNMSCQHY